MVTTDKLSSIYLPLRLTYGLVPLAAGADKFTNLLTDWAKYLPTDAAAALPVTPANFMLIVGVIEMLAGLAVLTYFTRLGAYVVMAWLLLIAVNLVVAGYLDIAVRDAAMAVGAYSLGRVAALCGDKWIPIAATSQGTSTHAAAS